MRPHESTLVYAVYGLLLAHKGIGFLPAFVLFGSRLLVIFCLAVLHMRKEGLRIQLLPVYCVAVWATLVLVEGWSWWLLQAVVTLSAAAACIFPVRTLAAPEGLPFSVGRKVVSIARRSSLGKSLYVTVFFPAAQPAAAQVSSSYVAANSKVFSGIARFIHVSRVLLHHLYYTRASIQDGVPIESGKNPHQLVVFSHGLGATPDVYLHTIQSLVCRGCVVLAAQHADGSAAHALSRDDDTGLVRDIMYHRPGDCDEVALLALRQRQLQHRVDELCDILDAVRQSQSDHTPLTPYVRDGVCVANSVAAVGHSFGAATVLSAAHKDSRITACALLDLWGFPLSEEVKERAVIGQPCLFLNSENFSNWTSNQDVCLAICDRAIHKNTRLDTIMGTTHQLASDFPFLMSKFVGKKAGLLGEADAVQSKALHDAALVSFLRQNSGLQCDAVVVELAEATAGSATARPKQE
eukprot:m.143347 g.143347  ORF g.143347 m.143347 type:complete len:465 (-) comp20431_c2_seq4:304-1698(-)